jgi:hypothetical protein
MMSIDGFDKGSQALQVHPRPAGQSIYRIDKSQPGANRIPGDYDRFHFAKSKRDFIEIDRDVINFLSFHKVAGKEQSLLRAALCDLSRRYSIDYPGQAPRLVMEVNESFTLSVVSATERRRRTLHLYFVTLMDRCGERFGEVCYSPLPEILLHLPDFNGQWFVAENVANPARKIAATRMTFQGCGR